MMDVTSLRVLQFIAHDVPRRLANGGGDAMVYSFAESPLDDSLRNYLAQRITGSLHSAGVQVERDPDAESPVPGLILDSLQNGTMGFVTMSWKIAEHLHHSQTGVNPGGVMCLVEVVLGNIPGLAILKLDKGEAIRIEQQRNQQGQFTFDLLHLRDLVLNRRTKIYKTGLFVMRDGSNDQFRGSVSDNQRASSTPTEVADFFLKRFLGCRLIESPDIQTQRFFNHTESYISTQIQTPEFKARYETALIAEMNNEDRNVNPLAFAEKNLRLDDRDGYRKWLEVNNVEFRPFDKDTQLIDHRLRKVDYEFECGVRVQVPLEALDDQVMMTSMDNELTKMEIQDRITRVRGKR